MLFQKPFFDCRTVSRGAAGRTGGSFRLLSEGLVKSARLPADCRPLYNHLVGRSYFEIRFAITISHFGLGTRRQKLLQHVVRMPADKRRVNCIQVRNIQILLAQWQASDFE